MPDRTPLDFEGLASLPQGTRLVAYGPGSTRIVGDLVDVISGSAYAWPDRPVGGRTIVNLNVGIFAPPRFADERGRCAVALSHWDLYTLEDDNRHALREEAALSVRVAAFRPIAHRRRSRFNLRAFPWPGLLAACVFGAIVIGGIRLGLAFTGGAL